MNAAALQLIVELMSAAHKLSTRLRAAHAAGRELRSEELEDVVTENTAARERLQQAIEQAREEGR